MKPAQIVKTDERRWWLSARHLNFSLSLFIVSLGLIGIAVFAGRDVRRINREVGQMYGGLASGIDLIGELQYQTQEARRSMLYALTTADSNVQLEYTDQSRAADTRVYGMIQQGAKLANTPRMAEAMQRLERDWGDYIRVRDEVIALILEGSTKDAVKLDLSEGIPGFDRVHNDLHEIKQVNKEEAKRQLAEVETSSNRSLLTLIIIVCLTQLLAIIAVRTLQKVKMLQVAQQQSEERLREVIESINEGMFVIGRDGHLVFWNSTAERMSDRERKPVLGRALGEVLPDLQNTSLRSAIADATSGKRACVLEDLRLTIAGSERFFDARIFPFESGTTVFFNDVTERKLAQEELFEREEQLRQARKLEAVGQLAGGIAHDFNNTLTAVIGYSDLLLRECASDPWRKKLEAIKGGAEHAASLTRQLLAFGRKQMLQPRIVNLNEIVNQSLVLLGRLINEDIQILPSLEPVLRPIKVDPNQIQQVIMNLAINAADAMPSGGTMTIETSNVTLDQSYARYHVSVMPGDYVMLVVSDTGHGMDKAIQERVFEPFFTTKDKAKGAGIGLATVFGIVKQSGGNIWVYSEPGLGTTFKVYLPVIAETVEVTAKSVPVFPGGTETILLVEDEEAVRAVANEILKKGGYNVMVAENGVDALKVCQQSGAAIDLLVSDVIMPHMNGQELAKRALTLKPGLRVLFMSGYTEDAIVRHGVIDDSVHFIQKPFSTEDFLVKIRHVLGAAV